MTKIAQEAFNDELQKIADYISEIAGNIANPLNVIGSPIGALVAALTDTNSDSEMALQNKRGVSNILIPGMGSYNMLKRMGWEKAKLKSLMKENDDLENIRTNTADE